MEFSADELRLIIAALGEYKTPPPVALMEHFHRELEKMELYDSSFDMFNDCGDACKL